MNCKEVSSLLSEYIDNELDEKTNNEVKNHLLICSSCRKEMEDFMDIKKALRSMANEEPSEEFSNKLCSMFKDVKVEQEDKRKNNLRIVFCLICIAICAIIIMSNIQDMKQNEPVVVIERVRYVIFNQ